MAHKNETDNKGELTKKGERTRQAILESALSLFVKQGYDATTMRAVAEDAGVSTGNAYYYFASKEHLIQGFYSRLHVEHMALCKEVLQEETDFKARLVAVLMAKIESAEPYHRFSGVLFKTAADPKSPLNPFSEDSDEVRVEATELMATVISGSKAKVHKDLAKRLPELLWLFE
ncbi:MAG: TetR family transcriptional regulator, partial [Planctomycetota bacterium]